MTSLETRLTKIGSREFRKKFTHLNSPDPVAITCNGEIRGYYVPTRSDPNSAARAALQAALTRLEAALASQDHAATSQPRAQNDEVSKLVRTLWGGREPQAAFLPSLYSLCESRQAPVSSLINALQVLVRHGRVLTQEEITARVRQQLGL